MSFRNSSLPWFWILFFGVLLLCLAAGFALPRLWVEMQLSKMPSEVKEVVGRFQSEPLEVPEDRVTPPETPADLVALVERHRKLLEEPPRKIRSALDWRVLQIDDLSEQGWERIASVLSADGPRIQALFELSSHPAYWSGIFPTKKDAQGIPDHLSLQSWALYLPLQAFLNAHRGDYSGAFDILTRILRLSTRLPSDLAIDQIIALTVQLRACEPMTEIVVRCDDVEVLRATLNDLLGMAPTVRLNNFADPVLAYVTELIRLEQKNGGSIEVSPRKTGLDYFREVARHNLTRQPAPSWLKRGMAYYWGVITGQDQMMIALSMMNQLEMRIREEYINSSFDLVLLTLANRIRELETGSKANDQSPFVPELLSEPLLDPFTEKPYLWDASSEVFYSVAPDMVDDGNRILYAPTNGTTSAGDFSLR